MTSNTSQAKTNSVRHPDTTDLQEHIRRHLHYSCGAPSGSTADIARAVMLTVRDLLVERLCASETRFRGQDAKRLYYLSMEFHLGRALNNALGNLGLTEQLASTLVEMGYDLEEIVERDEDGALGSGGMARLASCFLDSFASLDMPGFGYGLNYQFGLFRQAITNGYQEEHPGHWEATDNPWMIVRPERRYRVPLYGQVESEQDSVDHFTPRWCNQRFVCGLRHDLPIIGYNGTTVNTLRLFSATAADSFDTPILTANDYFQAIRHQIHRESISKMLYPTDSDQQNLEPRLKQAYFLVACAIQDMLADTKSVGKDILHLSDRCAMQLNDTNPALAIVELMRCLVDDYHLDWDRSWEMTRSIFGYTNNTLVPEALEKWPVQLIERVLPRHLQLIYEINHRFLEEVRLRFPEDENAPTRMSVIEEGSGRLANMSHLAIVGSHAVNGVALLHSQLLRTSLFPDFARMFPERFTNMTNGVTQRRWLHLANPGLSALLTSTIGDDWLLNAERLTELEKSANDSRFQQQFAATRRANKERLAGYILQVTGEQVDVETLFDVQIKRVREYKRQMLHLLYIIHSYLTIIEDRHHPLPPRTHIFAGKADPGDILGKLTIKLINNIAEVVNGDRRVMGHIKVIMLPDYTVSLAERIIPAADLGEQISTAGTEASGTSLMKLTFNGALTIGTLDGANIELMDEVGSDNIFIFGLDSAKIEEMREENSYSGWDHYAENPLIRRAVDCLDSNIFCQEEPGLFRPLFASLMYEGDAYFHLADFDSYLTAQQRVGALYLDQGAWRRAAICNIARAGRFSTDRTVREYAAKVWDLRPVPPGEHR